VSLTIKAPQSLWNQLNSTQNQISASIDLTNLTAGQHTVPVIVKVGLQPTAITRVSPESVVLILELVERKNLPIKLITRGEPATGFQVGAAQIEPDQVEISGPSSQVAKVVEVPIQLDLTQAKESVKQVLTLSPIGSDGNPVTGVSLSPEKVTVSIPVTQRGGYRNVVVKVILNGQVASGYRLTNILVNPPAVTVFSSDPKLIESLPGYIETVPININGAKDDLDLQVTLNLPENVILVDQQTVNIQVTIAAIEGGLTLSNMTVTTIGLGSSLHAKVSPEIVDVILTGPLYLLDKLTPFQVRVVIDLTGRGAGTYQLAPRVEIDVADIRVESVLPATIEVIIIEYTPTPTLRLTPSITPSPTPIRTPTPTPKP
jgi:YbbR domain-containing protein